VIKKHPLGPLVNLGLKVKTSFPMLRDPANEVAVDLKVLAQPNNPRVRAPFRNF